MLRRAATVLSLVALACASGCSSSTPRGTAATPGNGSHAPASGTRAPFRDALPDIAVEGLDGKVASLRDLVKGKVAVLDLWATWCGACHEVTARTVELARSSADDAGLVVLGIDQGEDRSTVAGYIDGSNIPYPIYIDHEFELADGVGSDRLPTIIVVDAQGNVRTVAHQLDGHILDLLAELLPSRPAKAVGPEVTQATDH
ncbi:MAG: TlpA disulfide reductase family protein [Polyangiaceae bacterium]